MHHLKCITTIAVLMAVTMGAAIPADLVPEKLSVADAVKLALSANVSMKGARSSQLTSLSRLRIAELKTTYSVGANTSLERAPSDSGMANSIFGSLGYQNLLGTQASLDVSPFGTGTERTSLGLTLRHPLASRRGILSEKADVVQSARSQMVIQDKQAYQTQQSTVLSVIRAYYNAVEAREEVKVQEKALALVEQSAKDAKRREEEGYARGIDVYRAEVQVQQTRQRLNVRRESAKAAIDRLMLAIGVGVGANPELADAVPEIKPVVPSLEEAIAKALKSRAELSVYDERLTTQQRQLAIAGEEFRPGVDVVARFRSTSSDTDVLSASILDEGSTTVGLEIRMPLDRRAIREEREIAGRELGLLNEERDFQEEEIAEEVRSAYRSLESTAVSLEILTQNLEVAKRNLHIAGRMVEEGEGDNRDVLSAQESLTNAESGIITARVDLYLATTELSYALGEDLTTVGLK